MGELRCLGVGLFLFTSACVVRDYDLLDLQNKTLDDLATSDVLSSPPDLASSPDLMPSCLEVADESLGIFVSPSGTDVSSCGIEAQPCATLQQGVTRAREDGKSYVFPAPGAYSQSVVLEKGVTIVGGWSQVGESWQRSCPGNRELVTIIGDDVAVEAIDVGGAAGIEAVTIANRTLFAHDGWSTYGIFAVGASTKLSVRNVLVETGDGNPGADGMAPGPAGAPKSAGGCSDTATATGMSGAPGRDGAAKVGDFDRDGYRRGDGADGDPGALGGNGSLNPPGSSSSCSSSCQGNMSTGCTPAPPVSVSGTPGAVGCGGEGGPGGGGGQGGGSSIALFAFDAQVTVEDSELVAGNGSAGGSGASGSNGGSPSLGMNGSAVSCYSACTYHSAPPPLFSGCIGSTVAFTVPGGSGTTGGQGGTGGHGSAGAGGWSVALVKLGAAAVTLTHAQLQHGLPGAGGSAPSPGQAGMAVDVYP